MAVLPCFSFQPDFTELSTLRLKTEEGKAGVYKELVILALLRNNSQQQGQASIWHLVGLAMANLFTKVILVEIVFFLQHSS